MTTDNLGDRMKAYEERETERRLIPMLPSYARIDGRCFSQFTRGMERPYDVRLSRAMIEVTKHLVDRLHARIGYTQSDEISLVWLQDTYDSEALFGGKVQKLASVLASAAAAKFNHVCLSDVHLRPFAERSLPHFDCRVFQLPNREEAANAVLWREQDATKNAISMAARSFYSAKQLDHKSGPEMQEMIFQKGKNFNDYPAFFKRGTFIRRKAVERFLTSEEMLRIPEQHRPDGPVTRTEIIELEMPSFTTVSNRSQIIFEGAEPILRKDEAA